MRVMYFSSLIWHDATGVGRESSQTLSYPIQHCQRLPSRKWRREMPENRVKSCDRWDWHYSRRAWHGMDDPGPVTGPGQDASLNENLLPLLLTSIPKSSAPRQLFIPVQSRKPVRLRKSVRRHLGSKAEEIEHRLKEIRASSSPLSGNTSRLAEPTFYMPSTLYSFDQTVQKRFPHGCRRPLGPSIARR